MRIFVIFFDFFHAIQHTRLNSCFEHGGIWSDIRGLVPLLAAQLATGWGVFQLHHDHQFFHWSLRGQNAISQPVPQPLQCHHGVLPAGFLSVEWPDQKYYWEGPTSQSLSLSLSLSLSCIYKKYSICTGSIINMCIITYTSTYLCIVMLLYFITFCTSINNVLHMQKKT